MNEEKMDHKIISELVLLALDNSLSEEQVQQLNDLIINKPWVREYYLECVATQIGLQNIECLSQNQSEFDESKSFDEELWQALASSEKTAPGITVEKPKESETEPEEMIKVEKLPRKINKFSLYTAIVSTAALIFLLVYVNIIHKPLPKVVATIISDIDAQWSTSDFPTGTGSDLRVGHLELFKGIAQIILDDGAELILEAPVSFDLESAKSIFLRRGKVAAKVPNNAIGFTVYTPAATIVDLGTEFGVDVSDEGNSELHMFKGEASLVAGKSGATKGSLIVSTGNAKSVEAFTNEIRDIDIRDKAFVRCVDSQTGFVWRGQNLDLADIAIGGNGSGTGDVDKAIDPVTGSLKEVKVEIADRRSVDGYILVKSFPFIDGIFVPDGQAGTVKVTSEGHNCDQFSDTCGLFHREISHGLASAVNGNGRTLRPIVLDGRELDCRKEPALLMHANVGITFDLDAIRKTIPLLQVARFEAVCGVDDDAVEAAEADFMVLVDGEVRFSYLAVKHDDDSMVISIELSESDRFLTLAVTDSDGRLAGDWGVFLKPKLKLGI